MNLPPARALKGVTMADLPNKPDDFEIPHGVRDDLRALLEPGALRVPASLDDSVMNHARVHFRGYFRGASLGVRRQRFLLRRRVSWVAAAASLAIVATLGAVVSRPPRALPGDVARDGRIDIVDALVLARRIDAGDPLPPRWDLTGDGVVDSLDVNAIAGRAVQLRALAQSAIDEHVAPASSDGGRG